MPAGRPTTYRPEYAEQARKLCRNGATDREIADILGVCVRTFYRWRAEYDAFAEALKVGKEFADDRVERALYERACGYEYSDVKIFHPSGAKEPVIVPVTVHVPADVGAAKQWLATRRPPAPPKPPENSSFVERFQKAMARVEEGKAEDQAREAIRFAERVETGSARSSPGVDFRHEHADRIRWGMPLPLPEPARSSARSQKDSRMREAGPRYAAILARFAAPVRSAMRHVGASWPPGEAGEMLCATMISIPA